MTECIDEFGFYSQLIDDFLICIIARSTQLFATYVRET